MFSIRNLRIVYQTPNESDTDHQAWLDEWMRSVQWQLHYTTFFDEWSNRVMNAAGDIITGLAILNSVNMLERERRFIRLLNGEYLEPTSYKYKGPFRVSDKHLTYFAESMQTILDNGIPLILIKAYCMYYFNVPMIALKGALTYYEHLADVGSLTLSDNLTGALETYG
jgi:hypothetical protein